MLGIDYHHRLSVAEAASFCQKMPSGTLDFLEEPIRDETPEAYESLRKLTDVPFAIGEEFSSQVAVPALHRARHPPVQPHRRLQCRRPHRGDEGRRLERGALRRHDAAQSAGADLHRGDDPFRGGGRQFRLARNPRVARRALPRLRRRRDLPGAAAARRRRLSRSAMRPASASRSTKRSSRSRASSSGKPRICAAATARSPTGRRARIRGDLP